MMIEFLRTNLTGWPAAKIILAAITVASAVYVIALFLKNTRISRQARRLNRALKRRNVKSKLEHWDGHKHVDIFLPESKMSIEVDGLQHFLDSGQILADMKRACASCSSDSYTFHVPNSVIERHLNELADAITAAAKKL